MIGSFRTRVRAHGVVLALALVVGALLRFPGTRWGLPARLHPDEYVIIDGALDMISRRSFEPALFFRPDHVEIQLSSIAYTLYSHVFLGSSVEAAYAAFPARFVIISRCITALFGLAMIVLAYLIGRRIRPAIGAIAAVLFAIFPAFVENSQYATPDVPMAAAFMVVMLASMHYLAAPRLGSLLIASAAVSVGIAIKYPSAIAAVMIAIVVVIAAWRDRRPLRIVQHGGIAIAAVVGFLFAISPVLFTNYQAVIDSIRKESSPDRPGADGLGWFGNLSYYADNYLLLSGSLLAIALVVGIAVSLRHRWLQAVPLTLGAIFWLLLSVLPLHWSRWGVPMQITPLLFSSIGLYYCFAFLRDKRWLRGWLMPVSVAVAALISINMIVNSVPVLARVFVPDNRVQAQEDLAALGVTAENTAYDGYTPMRPGSTKDLFEQMDLSGPVVRPKGNKNHVAVSSCMYGRYLAQPPESPRRQMYERIFSELPQIYSATPVTPWTGSWFEWQNINRARATISEYRDGASSGCALAVYRVPS